jgi:hypothetical protein
VPCFSLRIESSDSAPETVTLEFSDRGAARREATLFAAEMLKERVDEFWDHQPFTLTLADEAGVALLSLSLQGEAMQTDDHWTAARASRRRH